MTHFDAAPRPTHSAIHLGPYGRTGVPHRGDRRAEPGRQLATLTARLLAVRSARLAGAAASSCGSLRLLRLTALELRLRAMIATRLRDAGEVDRDVGPWASATKGYVRRPTAGPVHHAAVPIGSISAFV